MILSNEDITREIRSGNLVIKPFDEKLVQAGSVDLRLGNRFKFWKSELHDGTPINPRETDMNQYFKEKVFDDYFIIKSGQVAKAITEEWIELPNNIQAYIDGKSSWGRLDLIVHQTAGVIDAGFKGFVVLEIENKSPINFKIKVGESICQIKFIYLKTPTTKPYKGRYQYQKEILTSALKKNKNI